MGPVKESSSRKNPVGRADRFRVSGDKRVYGTYRDFLRLDLAPTCDSASCPLSNPLEIGRILDAPTGLLSPGDSECSLVNNDNLFELWLILS